MCSSVAPGPKASSVRVASPIRSQSDPTAARNVRASAAVKDLHACRTHSHA